MTDPSKPGNGIPSSAESSSERDANAQQLLLLASGELDDTEAEALERALAEDPDLQRDAQWLSLLEVTLARPRRSRLLRWAPVVGLAAAAGLILALQWGGSSPSEPEPEPQIEETRTIVALSDAARELRDEARQGRPVSSLLLPSIGAKRTRPVPRPELPLRSRIRDRQPSLDSYLELRRSVK